MPIVDGRGGYSALRGQPWNSPTKSQWQPTTTVHDPNPPIPLETPAAASYTMVVVWAS